ncbi:hypothetical protein [Nocardiopsis nanhaiensis]
MAKDLVGAPRPRDGDALELERLRRMYGDTYRVWRTPRYWMATAVVEHLEPTLMEESAGALEHKLRFPARRMAGPLAPL